MTTKDSFLFLNNKHQSFANDSDNNIQHFNLNLNQSYKCPVLNPVQFFSKTNNDKQNGGKQISAVFRKNY
jgi:hypothetical protein